MKIGLISDTHIPEAMPELWPHVYEQFRGVECILHAGDIYQLDVIDRLGDIAPVYAARGNGDDGSSGREVQPDDPRLTRHLAAGIQWIQNRSHSLHTHAGDAPSSNSQPVD